MSRRHIPRVSAESLRGASSLERAFALRWATIFDAPDMEREVLFHPSRKWRFDFAHRPAMVAIELDGGLWRGTSGAHGGAGAVRDREKDFAAVSLGWTVVRLTPDMARDRRVLEVLARVIRSRANINATDSLANLSD